MDNDEFSWIPNINGLGAHLLYVIESQNYDKYNTSSNQKVNTSNE